MEFDRESILIFEPYSIRSIIKDSLTDACKVYNNSNIEFIYDFNHTSMIKTDIKKIHYMFSNIIGNAIQVLQNEKEGKIWFKTKEINDSLEICIGNNKAFISENLIPKLFDTFFTEGKKDGTGLGLAIAKKIITDHGGKLWCISSENNSIVEFYFSLKLSDKPDNFKKKLPKNSREIIKHKKQIYTH